MSKATIPELQAIHDRLDARQAGAVSKYEVLKEALRSSSISFRDCAPELLQDAIAAVTGDGAALLLSVTSDGGALALRVIDGKKGTPFYAANEAELKAKLSLLVEANEKP